MKKDFLDKLIDFLEKEDFSYNEVEDYMKLNDWIDNNHNKIEIIEDLLFQLGSLYDDLFHLVGQKFDL